MKPGKSSWVQALRFAVQLGFMVALVAGISVTKEVSVWLLPTILLVGVFFCGWVCPFGAAQEWLGKLGKWMHLPQLRMPQGVQRYLQLSRYILFFLLFTYGISILLLQGPRNFAMLMGGSVYSIASGIIITFLVLSLFTARPFCNYFCTGGAKQGLWSVLRIFGIRRDTARCGGCGVCSKACPMNIEVHKTEFVRHPNCIGCLSCISSCPKKCLAYKLMPTRKK